jgi:hypothetical protein
MPYPVWGRRATDTVAIAVRSIHKTGSQAASQLSVKKCGVARAVCAAATILSTLSTMAQPWL